MEKDIEKLREELKEEIKQELREEAKEELKKEIRENGGIESNQRPSTEKGKSKDISRRSFLKKLGLGAAGISAFSLAPISGFSIKDSDGLNVYSDGNEYFNVKSSGGAEIKGGALTMNQNDITNVNSINGQNADNLSGITEKKARQISTIQSFVWGK